MMNKNMSKYALYVLLGLTVIVLIYLGIQVSTWSGLVDPATNPSDEVVNAANADMMDATGVIYIFSYILMGIAALGAGVSFVMAMVKNLKDNLLLLAVLGVTLVVMIIAYAASTDVLTDPVLIANGAEGSDMKAAGTWMNGFYIMGTLTTLTLIGGGVYRLIKNK